MPGIICLLVNLTKPEDKCTICGSTTSATGPQPEVHVHETERIIIEKQAPAPAQASDNKTEKPKINLKFCPNCGAALGEASNFCELCGEDLKKH